LSTSASQRMISNLQGVGNACTNPHIHYLGKGSDEMDAFLDSHICNNACRGIRLCHARVFVCVFVCVCVCVCVSLSLSLSLSVCLSVSLCACVCAYVCAYICMYICM
jgi:hypothetical protein